MWGIESIALAEWWHFLFAFFFFTRRSRTGVGVGDFESRKLAVGLTSTFVEPNRHRNKASMPPMPTGIGGCKTAPARVKLIRREQSHAKKKQVRIAPRSLKLRRIATPSTRPETEWLLHTTHWRFRLRDNPDSFGR